MCFVWKLIDLRVHNVVSQAIAVVAMGNIYLDLSGTGAILGQAATKYLKLDTSSNVLPFMVMCALVFFALLTMILDFHVLTSITCEYNYPL
ncbi:hypothetical protein DPMN_106539 [Dreissena polymorpha]|uniref:Uncharacterized protein n=1 Tax=Dreissena polymorpha TaxID=45954 RepID=A0A9D4QJV7_DREPO|nr:hypothetical protein DPMN_106539 [Dreissena polymorpha]